jgi:glycosyltransferase involved in cell wall biosynthesis
MQRFALVLQDNLTLLGHEVRLIRPQPFFGKIKPNYSSLGKWLGYIDKFALFPLQLRQAAAWADVVHICDHSNAMYVKYLQNVPHLVTCHDLLAVRSALGEDTGCIVSPTGKFLQNWILGSLKQAQMIACVSNYTKQDLEKFMGFSSKNFRLVLNGFNYSYQAIAPEEANARLSKVANLDLSKPFIFHIGAAIKRKNRDGIIRIINRIKDYWDGQIVFAGAPLTPDLLQMIEQFKLSDRIVEIVYPDNSLVEALYNEALALLFPSLSEGFGWPVIEAQACGCPVICSDRTSLPEVAGDAALIRDVDDEAGFAADILRLMDATQRNFWVHKGLENVKRFTTEKMIFEYISLYKELNPWP